ncbi:hydrogen peroxide-inducible genes activator [Spectribacter hydrogenooxidans]|uniref:LysR substrate-binding domain-containing protein n=1 Tax=Spectribacter hydrogenoxidans TaxID=3075608 RepID=A0ABU3C1C1_9GAMM|nr:LysR substrate-binding domain-containing protein [Salinisphaera sp. W335]MDT0635166.1 LysR substrate-binding domain-containing protein [Salinisphaera sp. W335]
MAEPTIKQLRCFAAVAEQGSVRRAALRLGVSQPTLTAQLSALETALGLSLVERSRAGVLVTALGRSLLPHVERLLRESREIINFAREAAESPSATHRLGVLPTLGPYLLPDVIPELHARFPALRIFVKEDGPRELEAGLVDGQYDLILASSPLENRDMASAPLFSEPLYLVSAPDHPLADLDRVRPADCVGQNFLVIEERHRSFLRVQGVARDYGFRLMRDFEGTSLDTLRQMIGTGLGVSFLPSLYIRSEIGPRHDVIRLEAGFETPRRDIVLAWRPRSAQRHWYQQLATIIRQICARDLVGHVAVADGPRDVA